MAVTAVLWVSDDCRNQALTLKFRLFSVLFASVRSDDE